MGAPIGPVQAPPLGFLGALALKSAGRTPDQVEGSYSPVIEMKEWLLTQRRQIVLGSREVVENTARTAFFIATDPTKLQIPQDEAWYVWNVSVATLISGSGPGGPNFIIAGTYGPVVQLVDGTTSIVQLGPQLILSATEQYAGITASTQTLYLATGYEPRRWFHAGAVFGCQVGAIQTGADTIADIGIIVEYTPAKV